MMILFLLALLIVAALLGTAGTFFGLAYGSTVLLMMLAGPITAVLAWVYATSKERYYDNHGR